MESVPAEEGSGAFAAAQVEPGLRQIAVFERRAEYEIQITGFQVFAFRYPAVAPVMIETEPQHLRQEVRHGEAVAEASSIQKEIIAEREYDSLLVGGSLVFPRLFQQFQHGIGVTDENSFFAVPGFTRLNDFEIGSGGLFQQCRKISRRLPDQPDFHVPALIPAYDDIVRFAVFRQFQAEAQPWQQAHAQEHTDLPICFLHNFSSFLFITAFR